MVIGGSLEYLFSFLLSSASSCGGGGGGRKLAEGGGGGGVFPDGVEGKRTCSSGKALVDFLHDSRR